MFQEVIKSYFWLSALFIWSMFTFCSELNAQNNFAVSEGGSGAEEFLDIYSDQQGAIITCGYFSGPGSYSGQAVYNIGNADAIIARYNNNVLDWLYTFGGANADRANAICTNLNNDILVCGTFSGAMEIENTMLNSVANSRDIFVAAFNVNGTFLWAESMGGSGQDEASAIRCDSNNNIYITGYFSGAGNFGAQFLSSTVNPETLLYSHDIFLTKLNDSGNILWTKQGIAENDDLAFDLAINLNNEIYLVGRYSGDITFDTFHPGLSNLAGVIVGFSSEGEELFFLRSLGGFLSLNEIEFNTEGNLVLGGTYSNSMLFLNEGFETFNTDYVYSAFVCEMSLDQNVLWFSDLGSNSELVLSDLNISSSNDIYIGGTFKCRFDEMSLDYGPGSFNSIGFNDLYIVKYSNSGQKEWQRNLGGRRDESLSGIVVLDDDNPIICGAYSERMILPYSNDYFYHEGAVMNFNESIYCPGESDDCNNPFFRNYLRINAVGSTDAFLCAPIDLNRAPLYFYHQPASACDLYPYPDLQLYDLLGLQSNCGAAKIGHTLLSCDESFSAPWLFPIGNGTLYFQPEYVFSYSPQISYTAFNNSASVNQEINVWLNITSADGCFNQTDSIDITLLEPVTQALISDDEGVNFLSPNPLPVVVCNDDSVLLTAVTPPGTFVTWSGFNIPPFVGDSLWVTQSDAILINTSNDTCFALSNVTVEMNNVGLPELGLGIAFKPPIFNPVVFAPTEISTGDTIFVCLGSDLVYYLYEFEKGQTNYPLFTGASSVYYNISLNGNTILNDTIVSDYLLFGFNGTLDISMQAFYECDGELLESAVFSIHVAVIVADPVLPEPVGTLCPGESLVLSVSGYDEFVWSGGNNLFEVLSPTSILINQPGIYQANSPYYDDLFACSTAGNYTFYVNPTPLPVVTMNPANGVICLGSSVSLTCNGIGSFEWYNAENEFMSSGNVFVTDQAGFYYCRYTNSNGCIINSNNLSVQEYFSPAASLAPFTEICPGISTNIIAEVNQPSLIQWQSPLVGNALLQNISEPGIYTFNYSLCGVNSVVSVTVSELTVFAEISGENTLCDGDSLLLSANAEMIQYDWLQGTEDGQEIYIQQGGLFQVQTTDYFGCTGLSETFTVEMITFDPEFYYPDSVCEGSEFVVSADNVENLYWYEDAELLNYIAEGMSQNFIADGNSESIFITDTFEQCQFDSIEIAITVLSNPIAQINPFNGFCEGDEAYLSSVFNMDWNYEWTLPDNELSNSSDLLLTNPDDGLYTLIVTDEFACSDTTAILLDAFDLPIVELDSESEITFCEGQNFILNASGDYESILWFQNGLETGISDDFIELFESGIYYAMVYSEENCEAQSESVELIIEQAGQYDQLEDQYACIGDTLIFELDLDDELNWYINANYQVSGNEFMLYNFAGNTTISYQTISENGCEGDFLSFVIYESSDCIEALGNVFSPNNDGVNDYFEFDHFGVEINQVLLFDRWGNTVQKMESAPFVWDGKNDASNEVNEGVYYFVILFNNPDFHSEFAEGYVHVLR